MRVNRRVVKPKVLSTLGRTVRLFRVTKGITQEELAFLARLDRSYIGGIERGERNLSFANLVKVVKGLGINLSEFASEFEKQNGKGN